ncbi:MAG: calcium-translocating P-type ATPase, SERCA-type [Candidatus Desantisbacteria bacterium]
MNWYTKSIDKSLQELQTNKGNGLSDAEAQERLEKTGPNQLIQEKQSGPWVMFLHQFTDFMILVLIGACIVSALLGEWIEAVAILAVVLFNGIMGFVQEFKAEKSLAALKKLTAPTAQILRNGEIHILPSSSIVPGDIVVIEAGTIIPADLRLIETGRLTIEEASLTGESVPISKNATVTYEKEIPLGDQKNMAFMSTVVTSGKGLGIAVNTGMQTELGKIAHMVQSVGKEATPLQKRLERFGKGLVYVCLAICALVFVMGIMRHEPFIDMFLTAVALAVSAIPEGLPIVVTVTLALGVQQMVKRHALIRRLPSVETLGCVQIICSDKTGTLTQNEMTVTRIATLDKCLEVTGVGYTPDGKFYHETNSIDPGQDETLMLLFKTSVLCNNARLYKNEEGWRMVGDPTEGALIVVAKKAGLSQEQLLNEYNLVEEFPFDSERKMMTVVYDEKGKTISFTKGAPDILLNLCKYIHTNDGVRELTEQDRASILNANEIFASQALRVLGFGYRENSTNPDIEADMTFVGIVGMIDPPREEVKQAIHECKTAGIKTVMITGDHKITAVAIAKELNAFDETRDIAISGAELDALSNEEFTKIVDTVRVYARVSPANKLRVVTALKAMGYTVAMTGDGVNDAPAVKEADIGIAMGITGTDVTKEASDMVLTDDNFASIVSAVKEGRRIYANIKKAIHFLLSCNMGEVIVIFVAMLMGMPLPLLPLQILWMNLVTDGFPALALAVEKEEAGIMKQPPRSPKEDIMPRQLGIMILIEGIFMGICTLAAYMMYSPNNPEEVMKARTMAFTVLVFCQKFHLFNCRSLTVSTFKIGFFTNWWLVLSVLFILCTQVAIVHIPCLQSIFKTVPITLHDWGIVIGLSILPLVGMEVYKWVIGRKR